MRAQNAFHEFSRTTVADRRELVGRIKDGLIARSAELAETITTEMGAPISLSRSAHVQQAIDHIVAAEEVIESFAFSHTHQSGYTIYHEPIGVCGLITPWNWPLIQVVSKVIPALLTGCCALLKASEVTHRTSQIFAEVVEEAGVPPGTFSLISGVGETVGRMIVEHPDISMISFTGSTSAGADVARRAANTVKRVVQELGGKSAYIVAMEDPANSILDASIRCFINSGQACNAPTRLLVPRKFLSIAEEISSQVANNLIIGDPLDPVTEIGPVSTIKQYNSVLSRIEKAVAMGTRLVSGGVRPPSGLSTGFFVRPTVFTCNDPSVPIAQEEVFGPVLCIIPYDTDSHAIEIANCTRYGLAAYISCEDAQRTQSFVRSVRAGVVHVNGAALDLSAPFGGYGQSGNGRECGTAGILNYLETKAAFSNAG